MGSDRVQKNAIPSKLELLSRMVEQEHRRLAYLQKAEFSKLNGDLDKAIQWYEKQMVVSREYLKIALLHNLHYEKPIEIPSIVQPMINTLFVMADCLQSKDQLQKAEKARAEAMELSGEHLAVSGRAETERSRAASLIGQGRFNEALVALMSSRDLFLRENNTIQVARVTMDMVDILQWLGDHKRALSELEHVSNLIEPLIGDRSLTHQDISVLILGSVMDIMSGKGSGMQAQDTMALYRLSLELKYYQGIIHKALLKFDAAERCFISVLPEYQKLGVGPAIECQMASVLIGKAKYDEGLRYAESLEPIFRSKQSLRPKLAALLRLQAEAFLNLGKTDTALNKLNKGIEDLTKYYDPDLLWRLHWLKGRALELEGRSGEALAAYADGANTINNLRKAPLGYRLDSTYLQDKIPLFIAAISLAARNNVPQECCRFIEMIKSRTLTITLGIPIGQTGIKQEFSDLEQKMDELARKLDAIEYSAYTGDKETNEARSLREELLAERALLLERLRFSDPRWRSVTEPVPFDYGQISDLLSRRQQAALNLFYIKDEVIAVLIKDGQSSVASVTIPPNLNNKLGEYIRNLHLPPDKTDPLLYDISIGFSIGAKHFLPHEFLTEALQAKGLIISPHGPLHLIPWAGLIFQGKRLFEYCPVAILPNLSSVQSLYSDPSGSPKAALIGAPDYEALPQLNPLPFTRTEIDEIGQLYEKSGRLLGNVLTDSQATEEGFWRLARHEDAIDSILHISCHGTFDLADPMNSGLLLTDSKIDAAEIARSHLKYDEVVLSACSTGWRPMEVGDIELSGDDILGLPGAFLEAGARSVLVSIPKADDAASCQFMLVYHQHRLHGKTPMAALQATQIEMLEDARFDPFTWIGFTLYGCK